MQICTFTITEYGTSGNELPPAPERSHVYSVLSGNESEEAFKERMQMEGMVVRDLLNTRFEERPKPYSCADSCDWVFTRASSITHMVRETLGRLR